MFERLRFARYALRFERAFKSDDWEPVKACFAPDASYTIIGGEPPFDGETRGSDEIVRLFKRMLDEIDRKFDRRIPGLAGVPRLRDGELHMPWKARYVTGERSIPLRGLTRCRFVGGKISALSDTMDPDEVRRWAEEAQRQVSAPR
jgi:ketosteroid isomerase-like protein